MADLRTFAADEIAATVSMAAAIAALRSSFAAGVTHIERSSHRVAGGELLVMPAVDANAAGVKLLVVQPANAPRGDPVIQGTYVLFDGAAGRPVALLDGSALTLLRTPAVSAIATDVLARAEARTLGIIGSGPQAVPHVAAILCVRPQLERIVVASRTPVNAAHAAQRLSDAPGVSVGPDGRRRVVLTGSYQDAAGCDIVCLLTRATEALIARADVAPGTHLNLVGSYRPDMREVTADLVATSTVYVDDLAATRHEAGDLIRAVAEGAWTWDRVVGDLAELSAATVARRDDGEITMFKNVGLAAEDLVIARLVAGL